MGTLNHTFHGASSQNVVLSPIIRTVDTDFGFLKIDLGFDKDYVWSSEWGGRQIRYNFFLLHFKTFSSPGRTKNCPTDKFCPTDKCRIFSICYQVDTVGRAAENCRWVRRCPTELYRACRDRPTGRKKFHPVSSGMNWDDTNFKFLI
jgi:hypothetical protein